MSSIELIIKDCREHLKLYGEAFITEEKIDLIEKRIKELEEENKILLNSIERYEYMLAETIHGEIQKYTPGEILLKIDTLKELLEEK